MTKITELDLRSTTLKRQTAIEIAKRIREHLPEINVLEPECKHSYAERRGFLGHCFPWVKTFRKYNL